MHPDIAAVLSGESDGCIVTGDCLEIMADMPDGCVDLVCTDPPYLNMKGGTKHLMGGVAGHRVRSATVGDEWKATLDWVHLAWRVARLGLLSFCSYQFVSELRETVVVAPLALLTWYKRNANNPVNNVPRYNSEFVWAWQKSPGLNWRAWRSTVLDYPNLTAGCVSTGERFTNDDGTVLHKEQKPIALMEHLLSVGGDIVCEPHAGLGTTCVAAKKLGRRWIGIEIDPHYAEVARRRIANTPKPLFVEATDDKKHTPTLFSDASREAQNGH